jgi:hypothetical protein
LPPYDISDPHSVVRQIQSFDLHLHKLQGMSGLFRRAQKRQVDAASLYFDRARSSAYGRPGPRDHWQSLRRPRNQIIALLVAASLAVGGVAASVAITIYGNNSTVAGQLSLGVGQAVATSCDQSTNVHTDTIGNYLDYYSDFILQTINVSQVDPNCGGKLMNLVIKLNGANDVNLSCQLPASTNFGATASFSQATFAFSTGAVSNNGLLYGCTTVSSYIATPVYLASIAASAVQIK